jgi:hypothetical protein
MQQSFIVASSHLDACLLAPRTSQRRTTAKESVAPSKAQSDEEQRCQLLSLMQRNGLSLPKKQSTPEDGSLVPKTVNAGGLENSQRGRGISRPENIEHGRQCCGTKTNEIHHLTATNNTERQNSNRATIVASSHRS